MTAATVVPCAVCGSPTEWACADCAINSGGKQSVHVCPRSKCQRGHERAAKCTPRATARAAYTETNT